MKEPKPYVQFIVPTEALIPVYYEKLTLYVPQVEKRKHNKSITNKRHNTYVIRHNRLRPWMKTIKEKFH
jgi:hypothetical protein